MTKYSVIDVRLETIANGENRNATSAAMAVTASAMRRTRRQRQNAAMTNETSAVRRIAGSGSIPTSIGSDANAWNGGNSYGNAYGWPKTGTSGRRRPIPL